MRTVPIKWIAGVAVAALLAACGGKEEAAAPGSEAAAPAATEAPPAEPAATQPAPAEAAAAGDAITETDATEEAEAVPAADAPAGPTGKYAEAVEVFRQAGESASFFDKSYGYAVFPTVGKAGLGVGGAHGKGRVYVGGQYVGRTKLTQLSIGLQAGAQAYSEIIFFEDKRAFDEFSTGNFEFGAQASAVAITASASAGATTTGSSAGASGGQHDATTTSIGGYYKGMAVFTVAKGGLMYEASVGGQKFSYEAR